MMMRRQGRPWWPVKGEVGGELREHLGANWPANRTADRESSRVRAVRWWPNSLPSSE